LHANVLVQPDAPVDLVLVVDCKLLVQNVVAGGVDVFVVGVEFWVGVDWAEL